MTQPVTYLVFLNDGDQYRVECDWAELTDKAVVCFNANGNQNDIVAVFPLLAISAFVDESQLDTVSADVAPDIEIPPGTLSN